MEKQKLLLFSLLVLNLLACKVQSVCYGEHSLNNSDSSYSIYIDKFGSYYPETPIPDNLLRTVNENNDSLFNINPRLYYGQFIEIGLDTNNTVSFNLFQEKLISYHAKRINEKIVKQGYNNVTFILVGFNNEYKESLQKLTKLEYKINSFLASKNKKTFIIKLFWDGRISKSPVGTVLIFDDAQANSYNAGIELRLLLNELKTENIHMISHSLGANVLAETLFNQEAKLQIDTSEGENSVYKSLCEKYQKSKYVLNPEKFFNIAMVAPAMPGYNTFIDYSDRGYGRDYNKGKDNYEITIGFNRRDIVLNKIFINPLIFGSTTLGCSSKEIKKVLKQFEDSYDKNRINIIDFSKKNGFWHLKHGIDSYMNMPQYTQLLEKLYSK